MFGGGVSHGVAVEIRQVPFVKIRGEGGVHGRFMGHGPSVRVGGSPSGNPEGRCPVLAAS